MAAPTSAAGAGDAGLARGRSDRLDSHSGAGLAPVGGFAPADGVEREPKTGFDPAGAPCFGRPAYAEPGAAAETLRRRLEGSAAGGLPRRASVDVDSSRRAPAAGGLPRRGSVDVDSVRRSPVPGGLPRRPPAGPGFGAAAGRALVAAPGEEGGGVVAAADGALGSGLPCSARRAREVGALGGTFGSTGLVTLRVIRAIVVTPCCRSPRPSARTRPPSSPSPSPAPPSRRRPASPRTRARPA